MYKPRSLFDSVRDNCLDIIDRPPLEDKQRLGNRHLDIRPNRIYLSISTDSVVPLTQNSSGFLKKRAVFESGSRKSRTCDSKKRYIYNDVRIE